MTTSLSDLRKEYSLKALSETEVNASPMKQFEDWFEEARKSISGEPNAMVLSTVSGSGKPSSRVVLLKGFSEKGFIFFTNYHSRKGKEIAENHDVALLFFWGELERQVRIEGRVEKISAEDSSAYFAERPRLSQIGAVVSAQSERTERRDLEERFHSLEKEYQGKNIPRPDHWGGYIVKPAYFEFWQGRRSRLHDRISYSVENEKWKIDRLSP
ncbi:MAG: pyridoxamine 5'-phosphate oxidase [Bacteroidales bacterium]|nr:pyridoxamine 5'-phosphate oxidase [Bacteroidales bacterium]